MQLAFLVLAALAVLFGGLHMLTSIQNEAVVVSIITLALRELLGLAAQTLQGPKPEAQAAPPSARKKKKKHVE